MQIDNSGITSKLIQQAAEAKQSEAAIQTKVAKKQLDTQKQVGEAIVGLIDQSATAVKGRGVDLSA
jgi:RNA-binding protein YhbY